MRIDPNAVQWDKPDATSPGIDASAVQWDDPAPQEPVRPARGLGQEITRQVGLTARYGLEGVAQAAEVFTEPVAGLMRAAGVQTPSLGQVAANVSDATVIIVAQRISTILHADQILVMDDGKIVGKGTHEELMKTCETYQQIASSQLSAKELGKEA